MFKYLSLLRSRKRASRNANKGLKRIGIYGGKFDPIHLGHLMCAELTRDVFDLDKVLFVTSANPPHKKTGVTPARIRHEMVQAACAPNCYFEACDIEMQREGPSYTLDTVRALKERYGPGVELCLLISSEYLDPDFEWNITHWMHSDELFASVRLLVFARQGHSIETTRQWGQAIATTHGARLDYLDFCPTPPVSSTMLRERVSKDKSIWYMVLPEVWEVIRRRRLYGCVTPSRGTHLQKLMRRLSFTAKRYLDIVLRRFRSL